MDQETIKAMRTWSLDPLAWVWVIGGRVIFPDEVQARPDDEKLIEFVRSRTQAVARQPEREAG